MKIDKHMIIVIGGRVYKAPGVTRIEIKGADFEMDYEWGRFTLKCNTSDVALFTDKPSMTDVLLPDETGYSPRLWEANTGKRFFDSIREQIENDNDVMGAVRRTVREAMKEAEREQMRKGTTLSGGD